MQDKNLDKNQSSASTREGSKKEKKSSSTFGARASQLSTKLMKGKKQHKEIKQGAA